MPAHATAAIVAYPALAAQPAELPRAVPADWGIYPHLLNVDEATFRFLEDVLDEVMALFPGAVRAHRRRRGGEGQWQASPRVRARMRELGIADASGVQGYFERRLGDYLSAHGRRLAGWDEILAAGLGAECHGDVLARRAGRDRGGAGGARHGARSRPAHVPRSPPGRLARRSRRAAAR